MPSDPWLIYGAAGYTAGLVLEQALKRGHRPIIAGRKAAALAPIAERLGLEQRVFSLDLPEAVDRGIEGVRLVVHLAGPYAQTADPMVEACLRGGVHYLDLNGEIDVYERHFARDAQARSRLVTLISGVGFDVVPTDCLALMLKQALPDACELELAFGGFGKSMGSRGTFKTLIATLGEGARIRVGGRLQRVPFFWRTPRVEFPQGSFRCLTMPWGDVATAFASTGIPDIAVYMAAPAGLPFALRVLAPLLRLGWVRRALDYWVSRFVTGPDQAAREASSAAAWGRARNARGQSVELSMRTPEGYTLTAASTLAAVERLLAGGVPFGAMPPGVAFGKDFVLGLEGVSVSALKVEESKVEGRRVA